MTEGPAELILEIFCPVGWLLKREGFAKICTAGIVKSINPWIQIPELSQL
jgi:hypothetical protein